MSDSEKVEGELPFINVRPRVPLGVRRSGEYLEKFDVAGSSVCLLSRHVEYEMSRIELVTKARFALTPRGVAHQSFYLLTGELTYLARDVRIKSGSSFRVEGEYEPLVFEASCWTSLLYFSTVSDFSSLREGLERA